MTHKNDNQAAAVMSHWLAQTEDTVYEALDLRIPDYVTDELNGIDVYAKYPDLRAYIVSNAHALQLYTDLRKAEQVLSQQSSPTRSTAFVPDLSFLPAPNPWEKLFDRAISWAEDLDIKLNLRLPDIPEVAQRMREMLRHTQGQWQFVSGTSSPAPIYGFGGGTLAEAQWLGALYVLARQHADNPQADINKLAQQIAKQAGLPSKYHKAFVKACVGWLANPQ